MVTKDEALDKALEGAANYIDALGGDSRKYRQALANAALDKMAENARELGLDYEPWKPSDTAHRPGGLPQDFIKHEVENEGDWSEWVNPKPEQYFMKCCDCGLVHEMQFKVAKYSEGDECKFVADADLQAVFRARRTAPPAPVQKPVWIRPDELQKAQKAPFLCRVEPNKRDDFVPLYTTPPAAQRQWVGLTDAEVMQTMSGDWTSQFYFARAIEAKLKELNK